MGKYTLQDEHFGTILLYTRKGMKSMSAKWENGQLRLNIPEESTAEWIKKQIKPMRDQIDALNKHVITFEIGQVIPCYKHQITIKTHNKDTSRIGYRGEGEDLFVTISAQANINTPSITKSISACITKLISHRAEATLIPHAREVATKIGINHTNFVIGRGCRKLGHCTTRGEIQLSYNLMLYPEELIDFVICHELAHLAHHNHGPRFHALCNKYCGGKEVELNRKLNQFKWPIA